MSQQTKHTCIVSFFRYSFRLFLCYDGFNERFQQQGRTVTLRTFSNNELSSVLICSFRSPTRSGKRKRIENFVFPIIHHLQESRCRSHILKVIFSLFRFYRTKVTHDLFFQSIEFIGYNGVERHLHPIIKDIYTTHIIIHIPAILPISNGTMPHHLLGNLTQSPTSDLKLVASEFRHQSLREFLVKTPVYQAFQIG